MIKYWNQDYYFSYLHWNEEKGGETLPTDESVPVSKAVGEKGAASSQMSPGFGGGGVYMWLGAASSTDSSAQLCRWNEAPLVGASPASSVLGIMLQDLVLFSKGSSLCQRQEIMISQKTQFPAADLHMCISHRTDAGSKCTFKWINKYWSIQLLWEIPVRFVLC